MTTLLARSSRKADSFITTKPQPRRNVPIISGTTHNRLVNNSTINDSKKRNEEISTVSEDTSISRKKAKFKVDISIKPRENSDNKPISKLEEVPVYSHPPLAKQIQKSDPIESSSTNRNIVPCITADVNGVSQDSIKHKPIVEEPVKSPKRQLRSQESTKFKSGLSAYFPEYDEIIGNKCQDDRMLYICCNTDQSTNSPCDLAGILNIDTNIIIFDSAKKINPKIPPEEIGRNSLIEFPDTIFTELNKTEKVDLTSLLDLCEDNGEDLLCDTYFELMHKKSHRVEQRLRKTDTERAQHDKDRVIKLLEGLQGQDWLRLMGVSCIMDSKKKEYESARQYFITECELILAKFQLWRDMEKQKKEEKEATIKYDKSNYINRKSVDDSEYYSESDFSTTRKPSKEVTAKTSLRLKCQKKSQIETLVPDRFQPHGISLEFKSFFPKPYLRDIALGRQGRKGRTVFAWGHPVPEIYERDFDLPEELRDEETLRAHARRKRRDKRIKKKSYTKT